jgi:hypothetical protein
MPREISRKRPRDEGEQEERSSIRRGRSRRDEEPEEGERSSRRSSRSRDEDDERPARRSRSSRDEDGARSEGGFKRPSNMGRGRADVRRQRETRRSGDFPDFFRVDREPVLVKFLDDDFFLTYYEHWIDEFRGQKRQMSFVCLGEDCPLCGIGDQPKFTALINVADLSKPNDPQVKVWAATPNPADAIEDEMPEVDDEGVKVDDRAPDISDPGRYFEVSKKKQKNNFTSYKLKLIRERDLEEEGYDIDPLDEDEIAALCEKRWTEETAVRINSRRDLQDIADELSD